MKKRFSVVGLMIAAVLVWTSANAGEERTLFSLSGKDFHSRNQLSSNPPEKPSGATDLTIPLSGSISLELGLSSVGRGQSSPREKEPGTPPIPIHKAPGSDLRYSRLGVGLSFEF